MGIFSRLSRTKASLPHTVLHGEEGYILLIVTVIGLILAVILGNIMPRLHTAQHTRAMINLNEYRASEAAKKGIDAVRLGSKNLNNFQELIGYAISGATPAQLLAIHGNYASLFTSGVSLQVYFSNGNDGTYTVSGATNFNSSSGVTTEISVAESLSNPTPTGYICRSRGIFWALDQVSGITSIPKHDEYRDSDGNIQFISGCSIVLTGKESGRLDVLLLVARNNAINETANGNSRDDGWYFYSTASGVTGWLSGDQWTSGTSPMNYFRYPATGVSPFYYDFDRKEALTAGNYKNNTDLKYQLSGGQWSFSIGNNGSWRDEYSTTQLWNGQQSFGSGVTRPFQGKDNDADGDSDNDDKVEVYIFIRSTGITAAPGPGYATDKNSLRLVNEVNARLPNPMRQMLEAGFYLEESN